MKESDISPTFPLQFPLISSLFVKTNTMTVIKIYNRKSGIPGTGST